MNNISPPKQMNKKKKCSLIDRDLVKLRLMGLIGQKTLNDLTNNKYDFIGETLHSKNNEDAEQLAGVIVRNA